MSDYRGDEGAILASRIEDFVRERIVPFERDPRIGPHGPGESLVAEMRAIARSEGVITPHIRDGHHLTHRKTARVLRAAGLSPLGPVALNVAAPDEGNMYLLGRVASPEQQARYLAPLIAGTIRSAFLMTEPAAENGAGSDPAMLLTTARPDGEYWIIDGRKAFITGAVGASFGILMAKSVEGASMFLVDLPDPAIRIERILDTIDNALPGGHAVLAIEGLRVHRSQMLGGSGEGFKYAQVRLAPARLTHCMRWLGACIRAQEIATDYAQRRRAFGKLLIEHEGVGFQLVDNNIDLKQSELMIDWCADVLDGGGNGGIESSMTKVAVSESLFRVADRCVQVMGGEGLAADTVVAQVFRELRAFRIYDGPTEVHKWSLAKRLMKSA